MEFDENQVRELESSFKKRMQAVFKVLLPLSLSFLLDTVIILLSLIYAGHLPVTNALAVVGLSQTFTIMVVVCFIMGVASSADTLITQEYGAGNYESCAIYFNKMIVSTSFLIALFVPLVLFSGSLLKFIGVQSHLAEQCQQFLNTYYIGQIIYLENQNIKIMFRSQQVAWPSFVGSTLSVLSFVLSVELMLHLVSNQLWIIPISYIIANAIQFFFLLLVLLCNYHTSGTIRCLRCADLQNWNRFLYIALITLSLEIIESYNGEIMNLIIATISNTTLAAQNVLYSITVNLYFFIAFGVSTTVAIFVGNFIGMREVKLARRIAFEVGIIFFLFSLLIALLFGIFPQAIINLFTYDEAIKEKVMKGYYFMLAIIPLETVNWIGVGVLKGLGKMHWIPILELIVYYCLFQPLCYVLVKVYGYGFELYWVVYIGVSLIMITFNYSYLKCLSLEKIAQEIEERSNREKEQALKQNEHLSENLLQSGQY